MSGKVILVGAGPGDPGLLTRKGADAIRQADVVVYDRLVGQKILELIPDSAEGIDVGKQPTHHKVPQWRINEILLEKALEGKSVVRLKGGDPFVFGRGGEELKLLAEHSIPFEVVPGVTSAIAAPAYAGIPVTHRDYASSLHIITGHAKAGAPLNINFKALVDAGGTDVFLMGVAALEEICNRLLSAGMDPLSPAAIVEQGTTPAQRKVTATLEKLPALARKKAVQNPAVIVVGQATQLSETFDWFSKLPLFGKKVVVTRPKDRIGTLSDRLRELGADVLEYPCIETVLRESCPELERAFEELERYDWIVFTSSAGVGAFFQKLKASGKDGRCLSRNHFAAIGPSTAKALEKWFIHADYMPDVYDTEHLAHGLAQRTKGEILLPRAAMGSPILPKVLKEKGVAFTDLPVYDTVYRSGETDSLLNQIRKGKTLVTFTSASTVRGFVRSLPKDTDLSNVQGMSIGPQTAAECARFGIQTETAKQATIPSLLDLILNQK